MAPLLDTLMQGLLYIFVVYIFFLKKTKNMCRRRRFAVAALKQLPSDTAQLEAKLAVAATMAG